MRLSYHPATQRDVDEILRHYRREGGDALSDRFWHDLMDRLDEISKYPKRFSPYLRHPNFRRARLRRFPHLIVFRTLNDRIRITVIKHEKRHPAFGMGRE